MKSLWGGIQHSWSSCCSISEILKRFFLMTFVTNISYPPQVFEQSLFLFPRETDRRLLTEFFSRVWISYLLFLSLLIFCCCCCVLQRRGKHNSICTPSLVTPELLLLLRRHIPINLRTKRRRKCFFIHPLFLLARTFPSPAVAITKRREWEKGQGWRCQLALGESQQKPGIESGKVWPSVVLLPKGPRNDVKAFLLFLEEGRRGEGKNNLQGSSFWRNSRVGGETQREEGRRRKSVTKVASLFSFFLSFCDKSQIRKGEEEGGNGGASLWVPLFSMGEGKATTVVHRSWQERKKTIHSLMRQDTFSEYSQSSYSP